MQHVIRIRPHVGLRRPLTGVRRLLRGQPVHDGCTEIRGGQPAGSVNHGDSGGAPRQPPH